MEKRETKNGTEIAGFDLQWEETMAAAKSRMAIFGRWQEMA